MDNLTEESLQDAIEEIAKYVQAGVDIIERRPTLLWIGVRPSDDEILAARKLLGWTEC